MGGGVPSGIGYAKSGNFNVSDMNKRPYKVQSRRSWYSNTLCPSNKRINAASLRLQVRQSSRVFVAKVLMVKRISMGKDAKAIVNILSWFWPNAVNFPISWIERFWHNGGICSGKVEYRCFRARDWLALAGSCSGCGGCSIGIS